MKNSQNIRPSANTRRVYFRKRVIISDSTNSELHLKNKVSHVMKCKMDDKDGDDQLGRLYFNLP